MSYDSGNLEHYLYEKPRSNWRGLLPWTLAGGALGGALTLGLEYIGGFARTPLLESVVRAVSGNGDTIAESNYVVLKERGDSPVTSYVGGKIAGAVVGTGIALATDHGLRSIGVDVHSPYLFIIPMLYGSSDLIGGG